VLSLFESTVAKAGLAVSQHNCTGAPKEKQPWQYSSNTFIDSGYDDPMKLTGEFNASGHEGPHDTGTLSPRARFFMAEDNPGDVELMREAITEVGFEVNLEVAKDGAEAVALLLHADHVLPDLISLNFNLPKMQGFEVLAVIKRTERLRNVPVVMLTSSDAQTDRLLCQTADAYFVKSGDWNGLIALVEHIRDLFNVFPSRPASTSNLFTDPFWNQKAKVPGCQSR